MTCASFRSLRIKRAPALMDSHRTALPQMSKRALPKPTAGRKMAFGILPHGTLRLLNAALK